MYLKIIENYYIPETLYWIRKNTVKAFVVTPPLS